MRKKTGFYTVKNFDDPSIDILAYFLTDDVSYGMGKETFKKWVLEWHHQNAISSNATVCWKEGNDIVIQLMWDEDTSIKLTKAQYIYLMERWHELLKITPQEITILLEDGNLSIEGHNPHPPESIDC